MSRGPPYGYQQPDPYARQTQYPDQLDDYYQSHHQPSSQGHAYAESDYPADHLSLHSTQCVCPRDAPTLTSQLARPAAPAAA